MSGPASGESLADVTLRASAESVQRPRLPPVRERLGGAASLACSAGRTITDQVMKIPPLDKAIGEVLGRAGCPDVGV